MMTDRLLGGNGAWKRDAERQRRIVQDWLDTGLPRGLAQQQAAWQRNQSVLRAWQSGLTLKQAGEVVGVSAERARQMAFKARRKATSPAELWLNLPVCLTPTERRRMLPLLEGMSAMPRRRSRKAEEPNKMLGADYHIITLEPYLLGMLVLDTDEGERKYAINRKCAVLLIDRMQAFLDEKPDEPYA